MILKNICVRLKKKMNKILFWIFQFGYRKFSNHEGIHRIFKRHVSFATYNFVNSKMMIWPEAYVVHSLLVRSSPRAHSILLSFLRTRTQRTCKNPKQPVFDRPLNVFRRLTMTRIYGANPLIGAHIFHHHLWFAV